VEAPSETEIKKEKRSRGKGEIFFTCKRKKPLIVVPEKIGVIVRRNKCLRENKKKRLDEGEDQKSFWTRWRF